MNKSKFNLMQLRGYLTLVLWLYIFTISLAGTGPLDAETVKKRIVAELLAGGVDDDEIENLLHSLGEDGTWPGINYEDVSRTGFEHRIHSGNMVTLGQAYNSKDSDFYRSKKLLESLQSALRYWVENDFICDNWWHNQIGTPNNMVSVLMLVGKKLPVDLVQKTQPIIGRAHLEASGARPSGDRIKIAGILAKNLLFNGDQEQFEKVIKVIEGEIKFEIGRGMQYDYSFHHREDRVNNTLSYGLGYADAFAEWAAYVAGTPYEFSEDKLKHLIDYYLDGVGKTMVFGKFPDPGAKNRSIARIGALKSLDAQTPRRLLQTSSHRKAELEEMINVREGKGKTSLSHSTFFWHSEHFTFQRPTFYASVRMYSTRNHNMEVPYNSEGLKNHYRGDGTNYLSRTGEEYADISPVYDWQKIPGATIMQNPDFPPEEEIQKRGVTDFVGGLTDGLYGLAAFDFKSAHDPLEAKKAWFFFDQEYVCLGAGITAWGESEVVTTINQNLSKDQVLVGNSDGEKVLEKGEHYLTDIQWVYTDSVAYIFPSSNEIHLNNGPASGSWYSINQQSSIPREEVTMDVFKLWLDHGPRPQESSYAYIIAPAISKSNAKNYLKNSPINIISNTPALQAVQHAGLNLTQMVFYKAGKVAISENLQVEMDSPGQLMIETAGSEIKKITVADPSRKLGKIHFRITAELDKSGNGYSSKWDENKGESEISIDLPKTVYAGKSVILEF